ncbi:MAG: rod shape-determining protein MreC [Eubacterium sp.]|nr:rod shape-determining protein MreC [Eubacterium sp.]
MKKILSSSRLKLVGAIAALLLIGALLASAAGHRETLPSAVVGTVFAPCHYVAEKLASGLETVFGGLEGDAAYEQQIAELEDEISDYKAQLADYENLKNQNELYKEFLELKEANPEYQFEKATVIARDSADIYQSFTVSKGSLSGVTVGDAVLYRQCLVGIVDEVYPDYSVVKTVLDPSFNVSAYEIISGEISYVTGNAKLAVNGQCKMANLSSATDIAYGSIICTAGIGGTVPKGLVIGTVYEIDEEATDISSYAVITPEVAINELTDCMILTDF